MKIAEKRWVFAQKKERNYWEKWQENNKRNKQSVSEYWNWHKKVLQKFFKIKKDTKILEIGPGASPFIEELRGGEKYELDPLMDLFERNSKQKKGINYIKGVGEKIPFDENFFDLIIITNVIDHVRDPKKTLNEIKKVLKKRGIVYISLNYFPSFLKTYNNFLELINLGDPYHPHSFSLESIKRLFKLKKFEILYFDHGRGTVSIINSKKKRRKKNLKERLKLSLKNGYKTFLRRLFRRGFEFLGKILSFGGKRKNGVFVLRNIKN